MHVDTYGYLPLLNDSTAGDLLPTISSTALQNFAKLPSLATMSMRVSKTSLFDSCEVEHDMIRSTTVSLIKVTCESLPSEVM